MTIESRVRGQLDKGLNKGKSFLWNKAGEVLHNRYSRYQIMRLIHKLEKSGGFHLTKEERKRLFKVLHAFEIAGIRVAGSASLYVLGALVESIRLGAGKVSDKILRHDKKG